MEVCAGGERGERGGGAVERAEREAVMWRVAHLTNCKMTLVDIKGFLVVGSMDD